MANPEGRITAIRGEDLAKRLDPVDAARRQRSFDVELPVEASERLSEAVVRPAGTVTGELSFRADELGRILIEGDLGATLALRCERCLEVADIEVVASVALQIAGHGPSQPLDGFELLERSGPDLVMRGLVEDEILLAVPLVPKHEDEGDCGPLVRDREDGEAEEAAPESGSEAGPSPFAVLETLKKRH